MRHVFLAAGAALILLSAGEPAAPTHSGGDRREHAMQDGDAGIIGARFLDVDGNIRRLGDENGAGPAALVFVDDECPVSARYLGELDAFLAEAEGAGIDLYAVVSSPGRTWADARKLRDDHELATPVLFDASGDLAARLDPVTLGEAFVINEDDRLVYRGRIDDRFESIGRLRRVIRSHDLLAAWHRSRWAATGRRRAARACWPT